MFEAIMKRSVLTGCVVVALLAGCSSATVDESIRTYPVQISNLGAAVNSSLDEFSPSVTANGRRLIFTRGHTRPPFNRDFWESSLDGEFWTTATRLPDRVNSETNEGSPSFSADGQTLYFAATDRPDSHGKSDIYIARLVGREWAEVENPGFPVNTRHWESHPSTSADGRTLYFVSDRPGGQGGLDIWVTWLDHEDKWRVPVNLGPPINTSGDEVTPFIAQDGKTLYFASDGHPGLGGTDMFVSRLVGDRWSKPTNVGRPLNSPDNDEFFSLAAEGSVVYFSSRREGGFGGYDIYRAEPNPFPPGAVIVLSGTVRDARTRTPLAAQLRVLDAMTGDSISLQHSNAYSGEYIIILPAGAVYNITATSPPYLPETELFDFLTQSVYGEQTHDFLLRKEEQLAALEVSITTDVLDFSLLRSAASHAGLSIEEQVRRETMPLLNYVFFGENDAELPERYVRLSAEQSSDYDVRSISEETLSRYYHLLNIIGMRLRDDASITVTLTGTTDGSEAPEIARMRAEHVASYLNTVWGVAHDRMRILSRALPEAQSSSRSPEGREENRRVEITSTDPSLLAPLHIEDVQHVLKPSSVRFYPSIVAEAGVDVWRFEVRQGARVLRESDGFATWPDSIPWNWRDTEGKLPDPDVPLTFSLSARDTRGQEARSEEREIPIHMVTLERKQIEQLPDRTIERISLILFDFDRADIGTRNEQMLLATAPRLTEKSTILVRGYTDAIGNEEYNRALSQRRAAAVKEKLQTLVPGRSIRSEGLGESVLLFDNTYPEGRFYCRTVQILVETIK